MNCRHISKFMCNKVNLKSIPTPPVKLEHIYNNLQPNQHMRSLRFVSTVKAPKISAATYHDSAQQARISKRILFVQNAHTSGTVGAKLVTTRLQNLMQLGPASLMNFSTKNIVKSRSVKSISKHSKGSRIGSASSSRSSFIRNSNIFLQKFMTSNAESAQKRYESTDSWAVMPRSRQGRGERGMKMRTEGRAEVSSHKDEGEQMEQFGAYTSERKDTSSRSKNRSGNRKETYTTSRDEDVTGTEPLTLSFNIKDRMDEMSSRIRDDLMKIDGSLKDRLHLIKNKINRGIAEAGQQKEQRTPPSTIYDDRHNVANLDLMPVTEKRPTLAAYLNDGNSDKRKSVLGRSADPSRMVRIRRDMVMVDQPGDGRPQNYRFIEPMQVRDELMDIPSIRQRREKAAEPFHLHDSDNSHHLIEIRTRDAADADGVYFAPRKPRRLYS